MDNRDAETLPPLDPGKPSLFQKIRAAFRREDGSATIEFVVLFPIYMIIFTSAFELGLHMTKQVMLDRGLDVTVRALRLGQFDDPNQELLRLNVCQNAGVIKECQQNLFIEMTPIQSGSWDFLNPEATCVERDADGDLIPVTDYEFRDGQSNDLMLIRVCAKVQPMFAAMGLGLFLAEGEDEDGDYYSMVATSAFVIEPRS